MRPNYQRNKKELNICRDQRQRQRLLSLVTPVPSASQGDCWKWNPALKLETGLFENITAGIRKPVQFKVEKLERKT